MLKIDDDMTIHITKGDSGKIVLTASDGEGETFYFANGDEVRLKVWKKNTPKSEVINNLGVISEDYTSVTFNLTSEETEINDTIAQNKTYSYEIELKDIDGNVTTLFGTDEDGNKEFIIYAESERK